MLQICTKTSPPGLTSIFRAETQFLIHSGTFKPCPRVLNLLFSEDLIGSCSYCAGRANKVATSCSKPLSNHRQKSSKKHGFHAIFDPQRATLELFFERFPMSNDKTERLNRKRIDFYIGLCGVTFFSDPKSRCATSF